MACETNSQRPATTSHMHVDVAYVRAYALEHTVHPRARLAPARRERARSREREESVCIYICVREDALASRGQSSVYRSDIQYFHVFKARSKG
eukprot:scaffold70081_cov63-Phaeocystis_antarctica.AAC.2